MSRTMKMPNRTLEISAAPINTRFRRRIVGPYLDSRGRNELCRQLFVWQRATIQQKGAPRSPLPSLFYPPACQAYPPFAMA